MSEINQLIDLACPADVFAVTKDTCRKNFGVLKAVVFQLDRGITPFADFTTGVGGMDNATTWSTAYALLDNDANALRNVVFEATTTTHTGGDATTQDFPDSTSGLEIVTSYEQNSWEIEILQPSSALEADLIKLSSLGNIERLRFWFVSETNQIMGGLTGFKATSVMYKLADRGTRTDVDKGMLTIKYRKQADADDIKELAQATVDAIVA